MSGTGRAADGVESCTGSAAALDTATTGAHTFTVTAKDLAGNVTTKTVNYSVLHDDADSTVSGTVPGTLSLTVGPPASSSWAENSTETDRSTISPVGSPASTSNALTKS